jgi:hypothetical protein
MTLKLTEQLSNVDRLVGPSSKRVSSSTPRTANIHSCIISRGCTNTPCRRVIV